jgi:hypothetical protein
MRMNRDYRKRRRGWVLSPMAAVVAMTMTMGGTAQAAARDEAGLTGAPNTVIRQKMHEQLLRAPGGKVTGPSQITYGGGTFVIDFAPEPGAAGKTQLGTPNCPDYWVCFYDGSNYNYPRGKLRACGQQDLATWGWRNRINSVHDHGDAFASFWDVEVDYDGFEVYVNQAIPDVGSAKNKVDLIYIECG